MDQSKSRVKSVFRIMKWGDFVIAALIAILAVSLLVLPGVAGGTVSAAILLEDGKPVHVWSADELAGSGELVFESYGYHYLIIWDAGAIRFVEADCPDLVCVQSGWIDHPNEIAACVPGHLILKVSGEAVLETSGSEVDVIIK